MVRDLHGAPLNGDHRDDLRPGRPGAQSWRASAVCGIGACPAAASAQTRCATSRGVVAAYLRTAAATDVALAKDYTY